MTHAKTPLRSALTAVAVPWSGFVVAFLYYALLSMVVIGGANLSAAAMAVAYALPVAVYTGLLAGRLARALPRSVAAAPFHAHKTA